MSDSNIGGEASILEERRRKLEELREQNIAYINNFTPADQAQELHGLYGNINKEELEEKKISDLSIAGRIVLKRVMGNASFVTIRDGSGDIQVYISKNNIDPDLYKNFKSWDLGDIIGISGNLFKTKTEELTVEAHSITLITKSLRPMPEKHKGLADIEIKYRQRYLDLMSSPESKEVFVKRSQIVSSVRSSMLEDGFLEVETPMMHSIPGGAVAKPFITRHNALDRELFLRIAPELHLKRLLVGGFEKVLRSIEVFEMKACQLDITQSSQCSSFMQLLQHFLALWNLRKLLFSQHLRLLEMTIRSSGMAKKLIYLIFL